MAEPASKPGGKPGRKSTAAIAALVAYNAAQTMERPRPPHELVDEESVVWWDTVNAMPADYFTPETLPLLVQYCRHVVQSNRTAQLIEAAQSTKDLKIRDLVRLRRLQALDSEKIAMLATKLRLAQSSTLNARGNKKQAAPRAPWEG